MVVIELKNLIVHHISEGYKNCYVHSILLNWIVI